MSLEQLDKSRDEIIDITLFLLNVSPAIDGATATSLHLSKLHSLIAPRDAGSKRPSNMASIMTV